jgi:hypothetical protein
VMGLVDFANEDDMRRAIRKLDDTEFQNRYDKCAWACARVCLCVLEGCPVGLLWRGRAQRRCRGWGCRAQCLSVPAPLLLDSAALAAPGCAPPRAPPAGATSR